MPDPHHLLEGNGKVHRYVVIADAARRGIRGCAELLQTALTAYRSRVS